MDTLRFGIIGCGVIGPVHANALANLPQVTLAAVCDIDLARAQQVAAQYQIPVVTSDYHQLLARQDIDAVCICTPHYLHAEMAIAAAQAGKHIFCEKPMAISLPAIDAMIAAADDASVQLGLCFQHRFDPVVLAVKRLFDEGRFGIPLLGSAFCRCFRGEAYYNSAAWRGTWAQEGGGVLINQAIHTIDLLLWFLGDPLTVQSTIATLRWQEAIEVEDTAHAVLTFANGALGNIAATNASHREWDAALHLTGSRGVVEISTGFPNTITMFELSGGNVELPIPEDTHPGIGKACYGNSHIRALDAFSTAVLQGTPYPITHQEARRATELVLNIYQQAIAVI